MLRKALTAIGWTAAGLVGLGVVLYLVVLAINWRDRGPSATAARLTQLFNDRRAVPDADNAFVYLQRWDRDPDRRNKLPSRVREFLETCRPGADCSGAFDGADGLLAEWTAADGEMVDDYAALIAHSGWLEQDSFEAAQIPAYSGAADGQKMLLLQARELAKQGDAPAVRALLERDLRFWRTVLESSDILVSKMVATNVLYRHFEWGNLVLRNLPVDRQAAAIPEGWTREISPAERSLQRCIVGEWQFSSAMLWQPSAESFGASDDTVIAHAGTWLLAPLFQKQDTLNRYAAHYWSVIRAFDVPLSDYPRAVDDVQGRAQQTVGQLFPFGAVYNLPGAWIFAITLSSTDLTQYAVRVGDIEGVRRAALAAAMLRAGRVEADDVLAALANAQQRDPYTGEPLGWDAQRQAIVFRGLQPGERGEHHIYY